MKPQEENYSELYKTIELLEKLVSFDTTSFKSNMALIEYVQGYLADLGVESKLFFDDSKQKANLWATIGPADRPGIVLSGHTDVVPALEETWKSEPFDLVERDHKLYGRGATDMKGFIACALALAPELKKRNLPIPFHICLSYDEEVGCLGVGRMVEGIANSGAVPMFALIGEPTQMFVVNGQKGKHSMRAKVYGTAGHSSYAPHHVNAIEYAGRIIQMISQYADKIAEEGPFDHSFTVPHSTMLVTTINGGAATNVTPEYCEFTFEIRHIPEHDGQAVLDDLMKNVEAELLPQMKEISEDADIKWEKVFSYPGMGDCLEDEAFDLIREVLPEVSGKVSYGSEGGIFEKVGGIPAIICGPGNIEQAHQPNEYVEIDQLDKCLAFLRNVVDTVEKKHANED